MLLDVNETMEAHLADAKLALKSQVTSKILFNKQDVLGIGLVGTEGTDNMVADEMGDGQYEHVSVVKKVAKATFSSLEALDAAACSGASGDLIDGVVVAVDAITKFVRNLKFGKRLVLVTDGHAFMGIDDGDVDQIAEGMVSQAIRFTVLGVGLASLSADVKPEVKPEGGEGVGASAREQFVRCLGRFREKLGERFELLELSDSLKANQLGGKETRPTKAYQGSLTVGSGMALPVVCWRRVSKGAAIKTVPVSKAALAEAAEEEAEEEGGAQRRPDQTVVTERNYLAPSTGDEARAETRQSSRHATHIAKPTHLRPSATPPPPRAAAAAGHAHCAHSAGSPLSLSPLSPLSRLPTLPRAVQVPPELRHPNPHQVLPQPRQPNPHQVPPEFRQAAYTYGKDMVPVTSQEGRPFAGCPYAHYAHTVPCAHSMHTALTMPTATGGGGMLSSSVLALRTGRGGDEVRRGREVHAARGHGPRGEPLDTSPPTLSHPLPPPCPPMPPHAPPCRRLRRATGSWRMRSAWWATPARRTHTRPSRRSASRWRRRGWSPS